MCGTYFSQVQAADRVEFAFHHGSSSKIQFKIWSWGMDIVEIFVFQFAIDPVLQAIIDDASTAIRSSQNVLFLFMVV
jgi:hypothetical protein